MAVHPAVGQEARQVQGGPRFFGVVHGVFQGFVFEEIPILNGFGDAGQLLIHHPAGADIGVADLAVAHLPVGQAHVHAGRADGGAGVLREHLGQVGGLGGLDGVAVGVGVNAEAIHDDKSQRFFHNRVPFMSR